MSSNTNKTNITKHMEKMKELCFAVKSIQQIINIDNSLLDFCSKNEFDYFDLTWLIEEICDNFFIINLHEISDISSPYSPEFVNTITLLFLQLNLLRPINENEFLITEICRSFSDFLLRYDLSNLSFDDKYSQIDEMDINKALNYYKEIYEAEPEWADEAYCKYYNWPIQSLDFAVERYTG